MKAKLQKAEFGHWSEANALAAILDRQGIDHSSFKCGEFVVVCWAEMHNELSGSPFVLYDEADNNSVTGSLSNDKELGLSLYLEGYGTYPTTDNEVAVVYLERYEGEVFVRVYADINQDAPTHSISLSEAREAQCKGVAA